MFVYNKRYVDTIIPSLATLTLRPACNSVHSPAFSLSPPPPCVFLSLSLMQFFFQQSETESVFNLCGVGHVTRSDKAAQFFFLFYSSLPAGAQYSFLSFVLFLLCPPSSFSCPFLSSSSRSSFFFSLSLFFSTHTTLLVLLPAPLHIHFTRPSLFYSQPPPLLPLSFLRHLHRCPQLCPWKPPPPLHRSSTNSPPASGKQPQLPL